jgi:hypothetical protein
MTTEIIIVTCIAIAIFVTGFAAGSMFANVARAQMQQKIDAGMLPTEVPMRRPFVEPALPVPRSPYAPPLKLAPPLPAPAPPTTARLPSIHWGNT